MPILFSLTQQKGDRVFSCSRAERGVHNYLLSADSAKQSRYPGYNRRSLARQHYVYGCWFSTIHNSQHPFLLRAYENIFCYSRIIWLRRFVVTECHEYCLKYKVISYSIHDLRVSPCWRRDVPRLTILSEFLDMDSWFAIDKNTSIKIIKYELQTSPGVQWEKKSRF